MEMYSILFSNQQAQRRKCAGKSTDDDAGVSTRSRAADMGTSSPLRGVTSG